LKVLAGKGDWQDDAAWMLLEEKSLILNDDQAVSINQLHNPTPRGRFMEQCLGQVFWLVDRPTCHAFPSRSNGIVASLVAFVPTHSGGSATVSNRLPCTQAFAEFMPLYNPPQFPCQPLFFDLKFLLDILNIFTYAWS
jgi:hypothetical protein